MNGGPPDLPPPEARRAASRLAMAGALLTGLMVVVFATSTPLEFPDVFVLPVLLVGLPILALAQLPIMEGTLLERGPVYVGSIATITAMGLASLAVGLWSVGPEAMGLVSLPLDAFLLWTLGTFVAALLASAALIPADRAFHGGTHPLVLQLLPRTRREKGLFGVLSLAAGFGEEMAYRGYVLAVLLLLVDQPWLALLVSSVSFGVLHAYQGSVGIVRTGLMGIVLGVPVLATGSLWPSMAAHAMVDLFAGFVQGPRILKKAGASTDDFSAPPPAP
ncbi:MAG: CPBP family intramembrane metalloprotease [Gemmatimonadales bacterium]|nr:MAG: CPBP family intramembrane metalloprotease [Gemmatimonadales bacterium]